MVVWYMLKISLRKDHFKKFCYEQNSCHFSAILSLANAQSKKITLQDFQLLGKVQSVLNTAEKQGDLVTNKEKNNLCLYDFP